MNVITSADNKQIKYIKSLSEKKFRDASGEYLAEGVRWIVDALKTDGADKLLSLLVVKNSKKDSFLDDLKGFEDRTLFVDDKIFDKLEQTENGQGLLAIFKQQKNTGGFPSGEYCLFLDGIKDPGNLGTIIRTACAAEFSDIIFNDCVDIYNPKVIRSSMSAILKINIFTNCFDALKELKSARYNIIGADIGGEDIFVSKKINMRNANGLCLVIGSEAKGISLQARELCNRFVRLPMSDIESLNAAVSAGIMMYLFRFSKEY